MAKAVALFLCLLANIYNNVMTAVSGNEGKVSGGDKNIAIFWRFYLRNDYLCLSE